jgi:hypothetical protein
LFTLSNNSPEPTPHWHGGLSDRVLVVWSHRFGVAQFGELERRADALGLRLVFAQRAASAAFALALVKLVERRFAAPVPALPPRFENSERFMR